MPQTDSCKYELRICRHTTLILITSVLDSFRILRKCRKCCRTLLKMQMVPLFFASVQVTGPDQNCFEPGKSSRCPYIFKCSITSGHPNTKKFLLALAVCSCNARCIAVVHRVDCPPVKVALQKLVLQILPTSAVQLVLGATFNDAAE